MTDKLRQILNNESQKVKEAGGSSFVFMHGVNTYLDNLWHDANEEPEYGKSIVMIRKQEPPFAGKYFGSRIKIDYKTYWDVYNGFVCQEIEPSKWCYLEDIVTLQDVK